jgi:hypothetical protein
MRIRTFVGRYIEIISVKGAVACGTDPFPPIPFRPIGESIAIGVEDILSRFHYGTLFHPSRYQLDEFSLHEYILRQSQQKAVDETLSLLQ